MGRLTSNPRRSQTLVHTKNDSICNISASVFVIIQQISTSIVHASSRFQKSATGNSTSILNPVSSLTIGIGLIKYKIQSTPLQVF